MASTLDEAKSLVAAARPRGRQLLVLEQVGYHRSLGVLRDVLRSEPAGTP